MYSPEDPLFYSNSCTRIVFPTLEYTLWTHHQLFSRWGKVSFLKGYTWVSTAIFISCLCILLLLYLCFKQAPVTSRLMFYNSNFQNEKWKSKDFQCGWDAVDPLDIHRMSLTSRLSAVAGKYVSGLTGISPTNSFLCRMCGLVAFNHTFRVGAFFDPELAKEGSEPLRRWIVSRRHALSP